MLIGRLLQGFSAGAELGGVSVYLAEIATSGRKGFYTSWQSGSQQVAIMVAAAMGFALNAVLEPSAISDWGWRIPFLFGCLIVPFIFILRRKLEETGSLLPAAIIWRCAGIRHPAGELAGGYRRDDDGGDDHHRVLPDHRLCPDLW